MWDYIEQITISVDWETCIIMRSVIAIAILCYYNVKLQTL